MLSAAFALGGSTQAIGLSLVLLGKFEGTPFQLGSMHLLGCRPQFGGKLTVLLGLFIVGGHRASLSLPRRSWCSC